jgi:multidrug efflux pump subunit AcrA (membrane-fusion protein)
MKNKRIKMDFRIPILFAGFILFSLLIAGCGEEEQPVKKIKTVSSTDSSDVNMIECKGTIESQHHFRRYLREGEKITAVVVTEGSEVKRGDLLLTFSNYAALKEYTELSYRKLQYNDKKNNIKILELEIAKTNREISDLEKELEQEKKIGKNIKDYPINIQVGRIKKQMEHLNEELNILEKKRDFLKASVLEEGKIISFLDSQLSEVNTRAKGMGIRAPFAGVVVYVPSSIESLRPGDLVIEILNNKKLYVRADVWQHQLQYIKPGNAVEIFPDFFGEYSFKGKVRRIRFSHIKGAKDQYPKFPVFIDIEPGVKELKVGMSVTVKIKKSG